jgi:hypothetical protein
MYQHRKKIYFVVGVQSLQGAQLRRVTVEQTSGSIEALLPLEQVSLPVHVQIKDSALVDGLGYVSSRVSGIFGIEIRKINWATREGEPTLNDSCSWLSAWKKKSFLAGSLNLRPKISCTSSVPVLNYTIFGIFQSNARRGGCLHRSKLNEAGGVRPLNEWEVSMKLNRMGV